MYKILWGFEITADSQIPASGEKIVLINTNK